jgi:hypothetical protein
MSPKNAAARPPRPRDRAISVPRPPNRRRPPRQRTCRGVPAGSQPRRNLACRLGHLGTLPPRLPPALPPAARRMAPQGGSRGGQRSLDRLRGPFDRPGAAPGGGARRVPGAGQFQGLTFEASAQKWRVRVICSSLQHHVGRWGASRGGAHAPRGRQRAAPLAQALTRPPRPLSPTRARPPAGLPTPPTRRRRTTWPHCCWSEARAPSTLVRAGGAGRGGVPRGAPPAAAPPGARRGRGRPGGRGGRGWAAAPPPPPR